MMPAAIHWVHRTGGRLVTRRAALRLSQRDLSASASQASLRDFIRDAATTATSAGTASTAATEILPPYLGTAGLREARLARPPKRIYVETYGCQMNFGDTEIVLGILEGARGYCRAERVDEADVVLLMTCAIRENAESKIWHRLDQLAQLERRRRGGLIVGVLGCMAERLKTHLMETKRNVDIVCGPDSYRDLPRLLEDAEEGIQGINVMLSADETYADIAPVRVAPTKRSAFVSIMRGCNNMCAFCIVPFTRGRERSRPICSILDEVRRLSDAGVREITLLGQNVNSYCDESLLTSLPPGSPPSTDDGALTPGFKAVYRTRPGGERFASLLDKVSQVNPEIRIRFTSPHPKDFPDDLLYLMRDRANICKQIHLPAQSGSTAVLERMRRGYSREAYLALVDHIRAILPQVSLSSDFIAGFCGETEQDHRDTVELIRQVEYDMAYMYAYSMREKTMAHRRYTDDVPEAVKQQRLSEIITTFYSILNRRAADSIGTRQVVLVEGFSKKSNAHLAGKTDGGRTVVFPPREMHDAAHGGERPPVPGDYVLVEVEAVRGSTPIGRPVRFTRLSSAEGAEGHGLRPANA